MATKSLIYHMSSNAEMIEKHLEVIVPDYLIHKTFATRKKQIGRFQ